jgi:hypothetical protein
VSEVDATASLMEYGIFLLLLFLKIEIASFRAEVLVHLRVQRRRSCVWMIFMKMAWRWRCDIWFVLMSHSFGKICKNGSAVTIAGLLAGDVSRG